MAAPMIFFFLPFYLFNVMIIEMYILRHLKQGEKLIKNLQCIHICAKEFNMIKRVMVALWNWLFK